jgi:predicted carbohydrate-binding protein with CBM5 and CBM33 domain
VRTRRGAAMLGAVASLAVDVAGDSSGGHVSYSVWQRSDSAESFFNCSDVNFAR